MQYMMTFGKGMEKNNAVLKLLLVLFKSTNRYDYIKETVNLLFQYYYQFSEREKPSFVDPFYQHENNP